MNIREEIDEILLAPGNRTSLIRQEENFIDEIGNEYPIINNIPVLINNNQSVFKTYNFQNNNRFVNSRKKGIKDLIINFMLYTKPNISINTSSKDNYKNIFNLLKNKSKSIILIIGAGEKDSSGLNTKSHGEKITFIKTDIQISDYVDVICDAHDLPFKNEVFDAVFIQAVLEHVMDPYRCVNEIYRVLKKDGIIYSETPFLQQVHLGAYDITRFTELGHRRLFKNFKEIKRGITGGPGTVLTWSIKYFIRGFFKASFIQFFIEWFFTFFYFWLKYFDYFFVKKNGAYDSASGYFFIGKKSNDIVSDELLIKEYRGIIR